MKIAIGTASNYKVNAIKKVLHKLDLDFESVFDKADSEVADQPCKLNETKQGSINRAGNILKKFPDSDFGIGVEFGYEPIDGKYHMVCFASIVTNTGEVYSESSSTLELPKALAEALANNIEVDATLNEVMIKLSDTEAGRAFAAFIKKRRVIEECTENVVLRWLWRELY